MGAWTDRDRSIAAVTAKSRKRAVVGRQGGGENSNEAGEGGSGGGGEAEEERRESTGQNGARGGVGGDGGCGEDDGNRQVATKSARRGREGGVEARLEALLRVEFARAMADMLYGFTDCLFFLHPERPIFNGVRFLQVRSP